MVDILCPREVSKFTYVTCLEMVVWLCGREKKGGGGGCDPNLPI